MRILLTGHRGFIGSNMLKALAGHDVRTYEWGEDEDKLDTRDRDVCVFTLVAYLAPPNVTQTRSCDKTMTSVVNYWIVA